MAIRFLLSQINPTVGDIAGNGELLRRIIAEHCNSADVIVFPEGAIPGYPAQDLVLQDRFIQALNTELAAICEQVANNWVILGTVRRVNGQLRNSAAVIHGGRVVEWRDKMLLPTYDVFDEARYFAPGDQVRPVVLEIAGQPVRIGLHICEDLWDEDYETKVCKLLGGQGLDLFLNISASPYRTGVHRERMRLIRERTTVGNVPYLYCNMVGGQDELVFDGSSLVVDGAGCLQQLARAFEEDFLTVEFPLPAPAEPAAIEEADPAWRQVRAIELGIRDYFRKTGHTNAVIGLSGGIDSSLVAVLASRALGSENITGIAMPTRYNPAASESDARRLANNLRIEFLTIQIEAIRNTTLQALEPVFAGSKPGLAEENLQARIRGNILMSVANKTGALVLTTGNKTESALGYATLYGDMAGALAPIGDLPKTDVYSAAEFLNSESPAELIPASVMDKIPSAELRDAQVDPFDYEQISPLVEELITGSSTPAQLVAQGHEKALIRELCTMINRAEFKRRQAPPVIRVTGKAFGMGRRMPVVQRFEEDF